MERLLIELGQFAASALNDAWIVIDQVNRIHRRNSKEFPRGQAVTAAKNQGAQWRARQSMSGQNGGQQRQRLVIKFFVRCVELKIALQIKTLGARGLFNAN